MGRIIVVTLACTTAMVLAYYFFPDLHMTAGTVAGCGISWGMITGAVVAYVLYRMSK